MEEETSNPERISRRRLVIIAVAVLSVFCLCIVLFTNLFGTALSEQDEWVATIDAFMLAMAEKDLDIAYGLFSEELQAAIPLSELEVFVGDRWFVLFEDYLEVEISAWEYTSSTEGKFVELNADITYESGYIGSFEGTLKEEGDEWKIHTWNVFVPPEKFEDY